ncbi:hypothetical protein GGP99_001946 [Salinibacter ruber]|uniref:Uncharacterized protein n=1 Tax=Salinibacter ruber TaxID=146919 RepID=A0AAW5P8G4_9BACT|nr:hypothetical protein [Salinibacter ruber]
MISSRMDDQAPERSLRTGSNMPFSPVYLLENLFGGFPKTGSDNRKAPVSVL